MLKNAYLLAKIGADTAENERNFANVFQKKWQRRLVLAVLGFTALFATQGCGGEDR